MRNSFATSRSNRHQYSSLVAHGSMSGIDGLEFRIEVWDDDDSHVEELVVLANNVLVACGAYNTAVAMRPPGANLVLRQGARVIKKARE
jgi:hypothetical protein